jgi:GTP-binding protein
VNTMDAPVVAIIGRPNVGKSTLFNRILRRRQAVTAEVAGTTRDRTYALAEWNGRSFYIADTGGYIPDAEGEIDPMVRAQAEAAMAEADLIMLVTDAQVGPQEVDLRLAEKLRRHVRPVLHVVNKADNDATELDSAVHMRLGLGEVVPVSAESGRGTGDMLDRLVEALPAMEEQTASDSLKVAVLGRPNVGKSSIVNALLGDDRIVVSSVPGTTRDAVDTLLKYKDQDITLVDTAGLRRRTKLEDAIEYFTTLRTLGALNRTQVAVLVIEAHENLTTQDQHIAAQIIEAGKGLVVAVNKWDLLADADHRKADRFIEELKDKAAFLNFAPVVFVSALSGRNLSRILDRTLEVCQEMTKRVTTSELNQFIAEVIEKRPPPSIQGKPVRIFYITQTQTGPARFMLFSSHPELIPESYKRFVHNQIRERWGFVGVPVIISVKARKQTRV